MKATHSNRRKVRQHENSASQEKEMATIVRRPPEEDPCRDNYELAHDPTYQEMYNRGGIECNDTYIILCKASGTDKNAKLLTKMQNCYQQYFYMLEDGKHAAVFAADRALCKERELETWNACLYKRKP